jgi:hypothetical protein
MKVILSALCVLFIVSCSKKDQPTPDNEKPPVIETPTAKKCKISSAFMYNETGKLSSRRSYSYDAQDRLTEIADTGISEIVFSYNGNKVYRKITIPNSTYLSLDTISVNSSGLADSTIENLDGDSYHSYYVYNPDMEIQTFTQYDYHGSQDLYNTYGFTNGDNTSLNGNQYVYAYDTTKPAVKGNYEEYSQLLSWGETTIRSKHLVISQQSTNTSQNDFTFDYEYTPEGNISVINFGKAGAKRSIHYTYACN